MPAAPSDPTIVVTRSRAAHADPAGADDVVVEDVDPLPVDPAAVDVEAPVVEVVVDGDEQAATPTTPIAAATTMPGRTHRRDRLVDLDRRVRCGVAALRS